MEPILGEVKKEKKDGVGNILLNESSTDQHSSGAETEKHIAKNEEDVLDETFGANNSGNNINSLYRASSLDLSSN